MTGVEILATQEVATAFTFNSTSFCIALGIFIVGGFLIGIMASIVECDWNYMWISVVMMTLAGFIAGVLVGNANHIPSEYETQYKITISDEVSMNEFFERYEIIDQEGKIYTVREVK